MARKKETLTYKATCKTKDGKMAYYYASYISGGFTITARNLSKHRYHLSAQTREQVAIEIARIYGVEVISISDGRQS